jgi:cell shape-determining protein MreC
MNQLSYSQKTLQESDFPVKVEYQGHSRVIITLSQVDSLNFTYSYLDECKEYTDSLEGTIVGYKNLNEQSQRVEEGLRSVISEKTKIIELEQELIGEYQQYDAKQKKKIKRLRFFTRVLGSVSVILLVLVLI